MSQACDVLVLLHPSISSVRWLDSLEHKPFTKPQVDKIFDLDRSSQLSIVEWYTNRGGRPNDEHSIAIKTLSYNDTWIRDYGPLSLKGTDGKISWVNFAFNGWGGKYASSEDDKVSLRLASLFEQTIESVPVILEGGALEFADSDRCMVNPLCIATPSRAWRENHSNAKGRLCSMLKIKEVIYVPSSALTNDDTDGHIDTILRFLPNNLMAVAGPTKGHIDYETLSSLRGRACEISSQLGCSLIELPTPTVRSAYDGRPLPATYVNFLCTRQYLFVPTYGVKEDETALKLLTDALPNHKVVGINCRALVEQHGSLHCATMNLA